MLPTTAENNDDDANLNAAFVADNRLAAMDANDEMTAQEHENGKRNIEAETNKPDNDYMTENYDGTTDAAMLEQSQHENDQRHTIESNEEHAMLNDNFNESSSSEYGAVVATKHTNEDDEHENEDEAEAEAEEGKNAKQKKPKEKESLQVSANEQDDLNENYENVEGTAVNAELNAETADAHHHYHHHQHHHHPGQHQQQHYVEDVDDDADKEDASDEEAAVNSSAMYSNYAAAAVEPKQREDAASSADEDDEHNGNVDDIEMNAAFNSEWANLAEDLAIANDRNNELNNDIDVYDAALPLDLSNDIAVNDLVAAQPGFTPDPDAEFIDVNGDVTRLAHDPLPPKFEKLTIDGGEPMPAMTPAMGYHQASVK